jgi:hypothetical protein
VTVQDEACLRQGHTVQSSRGHQCSETTLTGESRFHVSTTLGIEPGSLMTGSKQVTHWTSGTVYECSEIAASPHSPFIRDQLIDHLARQSLLRRYTFEMFLRILQLNFGITISIPRYLVIFRYSILLSLSM